LAAAAAPIQVPSKPIDEGVLLDVTALEPVADPRRPDEDPVVLKVRELKTYFFTYDGVVKALDGVTLSLRKGETLGLVGETGCGKSVTSFSITRLVPDPPGRIMSGSVLFRGADVLWDLDREASFKPIKGTPRVKVKRSFRRIKAATERMAAVRGRGISMIFQEPTQAMNPIFSISDQVSESLLLHRGTEIVQELLRADDDHVAQRVPERGETVPPPEEATEDAATSAATSITEAIDRLVRAAQANDRRGCLEAAAEIGRLSGVKTMETETYYTAREAGATLSGSGFEIRRRFHRLRLSGLQRRYLKRELKRLELTEQLKNVYLQEMRERSAHVGARRAIQRRLAALRLSGFYFGLWGIRSHVKKPITAEAFWRTVQLLEGVAIANPARVARGYPHELSGGMIQRVMIAMALSASPDILIADEPTTALDVTIQAQILEMMRLLKTRVGTAILLITHDLAVIAEVADRVCVMYAGQIVETAPVEELFRRPLHPYSQGLLASIPRLDEPAKKLASIPGAVPNLISPPTGCRFHPRCPYAMPICKEARPPTTTEGDRHTVACYLYKGPVAVQ
jgi:peptide/nickel transport system ATP-binding protein